MEILAADPAGERARIHWLIRLRWAAVLGVLGAVFTAGPVLGLLPTPIPLYTLVAALGTWNLYLQIRVRQGKKVLQAGHQVVVDLVVLGALLYFSQGLRNPFSLFLAVQVMLGAILLPRATAVNVGLVGMGMRSMRPQFMVRWLGWTAEHDTWERENELPQDLGVSEPM